MCKVLKVGRSSYYSWLNRKPSQREQQNKLLSEQIQDVYFDCKQRYGSPRITKELNSQGIQVSRPKVAKLMQRMGLKSKLSKKFVPTTTDSSHNYPIAPNLLERNFQTTQRGQVWVSDITYLTVLNGFLYLTVIIDLYDRKVVGWAISEGMSTQETILPAWHMALGNRPIQQGFIFHSDRGSQYASTSFRNVLSAEAVIQSMSRKANCWDNAVAESFFKSLKSEAIYGYKLVSKREMEINIFEYIEVWYNRKRRHSYIGNKTILELEIQEQTNFKLVA